jgi:hypothetical protein
MASITRMLNKFELAFGSEDGAQFCALVWPGIEGDIPFVEEPHIQKHLDGFVLFNDSQSLVVGCFGVNPESLAKMDLCHLVVLLKSGDGYKQVAIKPFSESNPIRLSA